MAKPVDHLYPGMGHDSADALELARQAIGITGSLDGHEGRLDRRNFPGNVPGFIERPLPDLGPAPEQMRSPVPVKPFHPVRYFAVPQHFMVTHHLAIGQLVPPDMGRNRHNGAHPVAIMRAVEQPDGATVGMTDKAAIVYSRRIQHAFEVIRGLPHEVDGKFLLPVGPAVAEPVEHKGRQIHRLPGLLREPAHGADTAETIVKEDQRRLSGNLRGAPDTEDLTPIDGQPRRAGNIVRGVGNAGNGGNFSVHPGRTVSAMQGFVNPKGIEMTQENADMHRYTQYALITALIAAAPAMPARANPVEFLHRIVTFAEEALSEALPQSLLETGADSNGPPPFRVGLMLPKFGGLREAAERVARGWEIALKMSDNHVVERPVKLILVDTNSGIEETLLNASAMLEKPGIDVFAGVVRAHTAAAVARYTGQRAKLLILAGAIGGNVMSQACYAHVARTSFNIDPYQTTSGRFIATKYKTLVSVGPDTKGGHRIVRHFVKAYRQAGGRIIEQAWAGRRRMALALLPL
jgi:ABC-type branched-subunit amino acid transport system substrate-binding protein